MKKNEDSFFDVTLLKVARKGKILIDAKVEGDCWCYDKLCKNIGRSVEMFSPTTDLNQIRMTYRGKSTSKVLQDTCHHRL